VVAVDDDAVDRGVLEFGEESLDLDVVTVASNRLKNWNVQHVEKIKSPYPRATRQ
jgi:hypothetical protein